MAWTTGLSIFDRQFPFSAVNRNLALLFFVGVDINDWVLPEHMGLVSRPPSTSGNSVGPSLCTTTATRGSVRLTGDYLRSPGISGGSHISVDVRILSDRLAELLAGFYHLDTAAGRSRNAFVRRKNGVWKLALRRETHMQSESIFCCRVKDTLKGLFKRREGGRKRRLRVTLATKIGKILYVAVSVIVKADGISSPFSLKFFLQTIP